MIRTRNEQVTTRITVCNYCKYNSSEEISKHQTEPQASRKQAAFRPDLGTVNKEKKEKKEKNVNCKPSSSFSSSGYKSFAQMEK